MRKNKGEDGYILVGVLIVVSLALIISASLSQSAATMSSIRGVIYKNQDNFYDVERSINTVTAWIQSNSKNIVTAFNSTNFSTNFDLGSPTIGDNVGTGFPQPSMIKMRGTSHAVQLTNNSYFGTSAFPTTTNIDTGASFDAASSFSSYDFGSGVNVRLLVVWALATNGNYEPIFRVDAVTGGANPERGVQGFNFIKSALVTGQAGIGYYAETGDFKTGNTNNACWSYQYAYDAALGTWSKGAARSNCVIIARDDIQLKSAIHGNVSTTKNNGINLDGGSVSGTKCTGSSCGITYTLPNNPAWATQCAGQTSADFTATGTATPIYSGSTLATQCANRDLIVGSNQGVVFKTADQPYYFRTIDLQNNSNSKISFDTVGPGHKYIIYADSIVGAKINGNQLISTNLAPSQLEIYLTQDGDLTLDGTAAINGVIVKNANSTINFSGNFSFCGALRANAVSVTGNAVMCYDEGLGGNPALTDINFTLYKASQRYR